MKKLLLMLAVISAAICGVGCGEKDTVTIKYWHEFSCIDSNLTGDAYSYVSGEFTKFQSDYYQVNTTEEEASTILSKFCETIEKGVADGGYEIVGDDIFATFGVIAPITPTEPVATQTANFTKTRDEISYTQFSLTLESLRGDGAGIEEQLKKLSFYDSLSVADSDVDNVTYSYDIIYDDVETDRTAQWEADLEVTNDLCDVNTYDDSGYIFSVNIKCSYLSYNEKTEAIKKTDFPYAYVDSPSLYYHKFTQTSNNSYPKEIEFTGYSNTIEAPYFVSYTLSEDGESGTAGNMLREGYDVTSTDGSIMFEITSTTSATMTKYEGGTVSVVYTIESKY